MATPTAANPKILLVGTTRICQQIAYVLDLKDYALAEKLTAQNWEQFRDYQIYVCEFQRKSRQFVKLKAQTITQLKLQYLDDICRNIDTAYYAKTKPHATAPQQSVTAKIADNQQTVTRQPLVKRILHGMKHPFRAARNVVLRMHYWGKTTAKRWHATAQQRHVDALERQTQREQQKQIRKGNYEYLQKYLRNLKPSELLLYVLRAKPNPNIRCTSIETNIRIGTRGEIGHCCSVMVPFGNLLTDGELDEIYNSTYARIVKLSSLNRSYCLCNLHKWCKYYFPEQKILPTEKWETSSSPKRIELNFDRSCNLCCRSCRTQPYLISGDEQERATTIVSKLLRSGYLEKTQTLLVAGMGEVFYSPNYRRLITTSLQRKKIDILSNGTLFNEDNWRLLAGKYSTIDVEISVDATTAETYQKLRGADFHQLMKNLTMLSELRKQKQIRKLKLFFVVQRDNFREMPDFVRLGQKLGVDHIQFQRLNNWGTFTAEEYWQRCLVIEDKYLDYDLWCVLQDPIFQDPIVDIRGFGRFIHASERRYRPRYEREQGRP